MAHDGVFDLLRIEAELLEAADDLVLDRMRPDRIGSGTSRGPGPRCGGPAAGLQSPSNSTACSVPAAALAAATWDSTVPCAIAGAPTKAAAMAVVASKAKVCILMAQPPC
jgi:hypothetical protein